MTAEPRWKVTTRERRDRARPTAGDASAASKQNEGDRKWSVLGLMAEAAEEEWHLHDLRRTAATRMGELKIGRVIIAKILNHAEPGVTAIDDRHEYRDGKRRALELWAEKLTSIAGGVEVDHNVPASLRVIRHE